MNYQSPELYEMTLDGALLRQFTTAQQPSVTSHDIAIDCDNHVYVLDGSGAGSRQVVRVRSRRKTAVCARSGRAGNGGGDQPAGPEQDAVHGQLRRRADRVRVSTRARRPPRRSAAAAGAAAALSARRTGHRHHQRSRTVSTGRCTARNSAFFVYAGDKPEFLLSLPGKGGTLWLGIATAGNAAADQAEGDLAATARQMAVRRGPDCDPISCWRDALRNLRLRSWSRVG